MRYVASAHKSTDSKSACLRRCFYSFSKEDQYKGKTYNNSFGRACRFTSAVPMHYFWGELKGLETDGLQIIRALKKGKD